VNQSYVIATATKVDVSGVNLEKFDDGYFAKEADKKNKKGEREFFEAEKESSSLGGYFRNLITSKRRSLDASIHFDGKN
jgi:hypothetical protein